MPGVLPAPAGDRGRAPSGAARPRQPSGRLSARRPARTPALRRGDCLGESQRRRHRTRRLTRARDESDDGSSLARYEHGVSTGIAPCGSDVIRSKPLSQLQRSTQPQPLARSPSVDPGLLSSLDPALERIASGLGPSGGPPRPQAHPATTNGTIVNAAAPTVLRSPTARQAARWKAIQQALLQGLSMRATARLLGISRNTIRRYVRAGGPPGRQDVASSTEQRPPKRTCSLNR